MGLPPPTPTLALASAEPSTHPARMPRWFRVCLTVLFFGLFFGVSALIGLGAAVAFLLVRTEDRWAFTETINRRLGTFAGAMRDVGLIRYWPPQLPEGFDPSRGYLLVANHPSLIDVVLLLSSIPRLTCVVRASWWRSPFLARLLNNTRFIPGPGTKEDVDLDAPVARRIEAALREGLPVLVFPEGSRTPASGIRRFRRGAIAAACRAGVPILPLYIDLHPRMLMKGDPMWKVPQQPGRYTFRWFPPVETEGRDPKAVARELQARYRAEHDRLRGARALPEETAAAALGS
jgi:1-acyl-sn-glycerol-3-phosphate acyltransferase